MKRAAALAWPLVPCILVSLLIHSTDGDVGGIVGAVSSPSVLMSVVIWALPLALCAYVGFAAYLDGGWVAFLLVVGSISGVLGYLLARVGSTATSTAGLLWSVLGLSLLFALALSLAVLPGAVVVRTQRVQQCSEGLPS